MGLSDGGIASKQLREDVDQLEKEVKSLSEFANRMSQLLYGYREASTADMLAKVEELVILDVTMSKTDKKKVKKVKAAFDKLLYEIDEFQNG